MSGSKGLKYVGNAHWLGVPSRDLTPEEVEKYGRDGLLKTGLYTEFSTQKAKRKTAVNEDKS